MSWTWHTLLPLLTPNPTPIQRRPATPNLNPTPVVPLVVPHRRPHHRYAPSIPGQDAWLEADAQRRIVHSFEYKSKDPFVGKSVMVVGGRASGFDVSRDLRDVVAGLVCLDNGLAQSDVKPALDHTGINDSQR